MTERVIQILNTGRAANRVARRWLQPGEPVLIGPQLVMTVSVDRHVEGVDYEWVPIIEIQAPGTPAFRSAVPPECSVDARSWAGLHLLPRAVELEAGRPLRLLVEFVADRQAGHRVG